MTTSNVPYVKVRLNKTYSVNINIILFRSFQPYHVRGPMSAHMFHKHLLMLALVMKC